MDSSGCYRVFGHDTGALLTPILTNSRGTPEVASELMASGSHALRTHALDAADVLDDVVSIMWTLMAERGFSDLVAAASDEMGAIHRLQPLHTLTGATGNDRTDRTDRTRTDAERTILEFAEQSSTDVSALSGELRARFLSAAGPAAGDLAAALWVLDVLPRARVALDGLFGVSSWPEPRTDRGGDLWGALDQMIRVIPALDSLDPVTSELVRLRGARQHACRLCMSLRSRSALRAGADDATFAAVDDYRTASLTSMQQAALAFTDAMIWTPGRIDATVVGDLQVAATEAQQVELVLDVTRNALNKVAVALGADAAHVEDGIEIYDVEADGSLVYGLSPD